MKNHLIPFWKNLINSGIRSSVEETEKNRIIFINTFSLLGITLESIFATINIISTNYLIASIEIVMAIAMTSNALALRQHKKINLAGIILIVTVAAPLMMILLIGGSQNTSIFWLPMFPVAAYLLLGKKQGSTALLILFLTIGFLSLLESFDLVNLAYSFISIRQMILSLLVLTALLYVHENLKEQDRKIAKRKQEKLSKAYNQVKESEEMRDEFTSSLAHELRNSFVSIQKLTETWRKQQNTMTPEKTSQYIDLLHNSSTENLALVNSLLDVMHIDTANFKISKELNSLKDIIKQQVTLFNPQAVEKNVTINTKIDDEVPWQLSIDSFRIKQVVANLLSNALKYTDNGKTIVIHIINATDHQNLQEKGKKYQDEWYLSNKEKRLINEKDFVFLGVSHPEQGISTKDYDKLFKKFSRLESHDKLHPPTGSGLGLYIIKKIIESHSGSYGFASKTNKGVTFYITLPTTKPNK